MPTEETKPVNNSKKSKTDGEKEQIDQKKHDEKELSLLSLIADNQEHLLEISSIVSPEDFGCHHLREAYRSLLNNDEDRDEKLRRCVDDAQIEHVRKLKSYSGKTVKEYAKSVKENAVRRKIFQVLSKARRNALATPSDMGLASIFSQLHGVQGGVIDQSDSKANEVVIKAKQEMHDFQTMSCKISLPDSFSNLGRLTKGIFPHHIWMIGGFSGVGKSYFCLQLISDILISSSDDDGNNGLKVIIFSTENSAVDNMLRIVGCRTGIDFIDIKMGNTSEEQKKRIDDELKILSNANLRIYENIFDAEQMASIIAMHKMRSECDLVLIDYVQQLNPWESDFYKRMSGVASTLQQTALKNNVALICASQISNEEAKGEGEKMTSFKGAGELRNITDVGLWLQKGVPDYIREQYKEELGDGGGNPLMEKENYATGTGFKYVDKPQGEIITCHINKIRHAKPGYALFEFFTQNTLNNEQYVYKIDTEIDDEDIVDEVNKLDI